jgi:dihydrolipoamide dehydrogenase
MMIEADVAVIGGGPGGYVAAIRAAQTCASVYLIEKDQLGGCCLNRGCIPAKAMLRSVQVFDLVKRAREFGVEAANATADLARIAQRRDRIVSQLRNSLEGLLELKNVKIVWGKGRLAAQDRIQVEGPEAQEIKAKAIIVATGAVPARIPVPGADLPGVMTSDELWGVTELPQSMVVVGAGAIGLEFACVFHGLGTKVTVLEMMDQICPAMDCDLANELMRLCKRRGIGVFPSARVKQIKALEQKPGWKTVTFESDGQEKQAEGQIVLLATGRKPYSEGLGLQDVGVQTERGAVEVDAAMKTNVEGIYAIGDVTGLYQLAHAASAQGKVAAANASGGRETMDYTAVPACLYTDPEMGCVGLTDMQAERLGYKIKVGRFPFRACGKAVADGEREGFVKLVSDAETGKVLGVHILGPHASALIAEAVLAVRYGLTAHQVAEAIHAHPTLSEPIGEAAEVALGTPLHI